jgi:hypothetical protein
MHRRVVRSARGSEFLRCARSDTDQSFPRYPRLPVLACAGFEDARAGEHTTTSGTRSNASEKSS